MTKSLLESCKQAHKKYKDNKRSQPLAKHKQEQSEARKTLMEDLDTVNTDIRLTNSSIEKFKNDADEPRQGAETKITLGKFVTLV